MVFVGIMRSKLLRRYGYMNEMTKNEAMFLEMANDPELRPHLLDRLERLGLLSAFLLAESGTTQ